MTCPEWEARIALAVEGDAPAGEVEAHLAACEGCREFARELRLSQAAFKELRDEPVEQAVLDGIRGRAMAAIAAAPRPRVRWWWWLAPAAVAVAILLMGIMRVPEPPRAPVVAAVGQLPELRRALSPPPAGRPERPPQAKGLPHRPLEPLLMKIVTDDPDVVIYWIVEDKQKGE